MADLPRTNESPAVPTAPDATIRDLSPAADVLPTIDAATVIEDRYVLKTHIATGGMAEVWRAEDTVLIRPVAVKILLPRLAADPGFVARFRREAIAAARLTHPSIVSIFHTSSNPESIVMELVEGRTLREELDERGHLPAAEAVAIAASIAEALEAAHRAGIVHRDVKPANVLLSTDGMVKVTDFGIAKAAEADPDLPDVTTAGTWVGTAKYVSPEAVKGQATDPRSDVYSLGVLTYELLCGRVPFTGDNDQATAVARLTGTPQSPRSVLRTIPEQLDAVIMRALATDAIDRYQSAADFRADLLAAPTDDTAVPVARSAADATIVGDTSSPRDYARAERNWLVPTLLVSLVAISLGVAWMLFGGVEVPRAVGNLIDRVTPGGEGALEANAAPLPVAAVAFDPFGTQGEHDELASLAVDDDLSSEWTTENYRSRNFGGLKPGVGIVVSTSTIHRLDALLITSPTNDWSVELYLANQAPTDFGGWGEPIERREGVPAGVTTFDLNGVRGGAVLVWITDLGDDNRVRTRIGDIEVIGR